MPSSRLMSCVRGAGSWNWLRDRTGFDFLCKIHWWTTSFRYSLGERAPLTSNIKHNPRFWNLVYSAVFWTAPKLCTCISTKHRFSNPILPTSSLCFIFSMTSILSAQPLCGRLGMVSTLDAPACCVNKENEAEWMQSSPFSEAQPVLVIILASESRIGLLVHWLASVCAYLANRSLSSFD